MYDIMIHLVCHQINAVFSSASCFIYLYDIILTPEIFAIGSTLHVFCHHCAMLVRVDVLVTSHRQYSSTVLSKL